MKQKKVIMNDLSAVNQIHIADTLINWINQNFQDKALDGYTITFRLPILGEVPSFGLPLESSSSRIMELTFDKFDIFKDQASEDRYLVPKDFKIPDEMISELHGTLLCMTSDGKKVNMEEELNQIEKEKNG